MDGLTPTTAGVLHGDSRGYSEVEGGMVTPADARDGPAREPAPVEAGAAVGPGKHPATDPVAVRGALREPGRVYLMAPARWRSADSSARRRSVVPPVVMPAPAQWVRSRCVPSRLPARRPAAARSASAKKAAATRKRHSATRSAAAKKAAVTRKRHAAARASTATKRSTKTTAKKK